MMHVSFYFGYNFIMSNPASVFIILVSVIATLIYGQSLIIPLYSHYYYGFCLGNYVRL